VSAFTVPQQKYALSISLLGKMKPTAISVIASLLYQSHAQSQYGENQRGTIKDSDIVASAFPDVEGIELLSPAFLDPDSTPPGWANGTDGPTDDTEMGEYRLSLKARFR
jgi:hypothetical protein